MPRQIRYKGVLVPVPESATDEQVEQILAKIKPPKSITEQARESQFAENVVRSGREFGQQLWDAAKGLVTDEQGNPISWENPLGSTTRGLLNLGLGIGEQFVPDRQPHEQYAEAMGHYLGTRYAPSKIATTAYEDPVGTLADASMLLGGGSLALREGATLSRMANLPRTGQFLETTGRVANIGSAVTDPIRIGANVATLPLRAGNIPIVSRLSPPSLYQSAMKPRPSLSQQRGRVDEMVRTGLREGIPVTEKGVRKAWQTIEDLDKQVQGYIDDATRRGVTIDPLEIRKRIDDVRAQYGGQFISADDLKKIDRLERKFLAEHQITPAPGAPPITLQMTAAEAQVAKQKAYRKLKGKYGKRSNEANVETLKALARGANEELRKAIPEIGPPNQRQSKLLDFAPELQRAVSRIKNYQLLSLNTPGVAGATYALTGSPELGAGMGVLHAIFEHPTAKSKLAIAIYEGMRANPRKYGPARMATATARANEYIENLRQQVRGTVAAPATVAP